jgi:RNA polymerase sigma-70 factor (ECF subfamily)
MSTRPAATPDTAGFEALVTPLLAPAYRVAVNLVGDRTEAEDVVQEASLLAFRAFDQFEPGTNFKAWYFRILTNCCYGRHRQRKRRPETVDLEDVSDFYIHFRMADSGLPNDPQDPAGQLIGRMDVEQVMRAIAALPEEYRTVATLYLIEDLSYEEIAETLGCPVGTVRSRLHRGRKMLQKMLWSIAQEAGIVRAPPPEAQA